MKTTQKKKREDILKAIQSAEKARMEEELTRPRVEIWLDPTDDWAEWVRSHERKKKGNPIDICEMTLGMKSSPLCANGYH